MWCLSVAALAPGIHSLFGEFASWGLLDSLSSAMVLGTTEPAAVLRYEFWKLIL